MPESLDGTSHRADPSIENTRMIYMTEGAVMVTLHRPLPCFALKDLH